MRWGNSMFEGIELWMGNEGDEWAMFDYICVVYYFY
jgi:hypothetical protein